MGSSFTDLADKLPPSCAFVEVHGGGYGLSVGGITALERVLRGLHREGVFEAVVAAEPIAMREDLPVRVVWVAPGSAAPVGARVVRGDVVEGIPVVDEASRRRAEWALCLTLAKSHQGLIDGLINWRFSMPVTRRLSNTRVLPNHVTMVSAAIGLAGALCLLGGSWSAIAVGGLLIQIQSILDSCDGELARLRFQGSRLGQWLDNICDDVLDISFIVCAGVAAGGAWTSLAIATAAFRAFGQLVLYHEVYRRTRSGDVFSFRAWFQAAGASTDEVFERRGLIGHVRALGRRDTYVFMWMLLCLLGQIEIVVVYGSVLGLMIGVLMTAHLFLRSPLPPRG